MRSPKQRKLKMVSLHKSALLAKTFVFGLVLLVLPIVCAANNPPTVWLFNQSDSNVALNSSINIRISAADYDDAEIEIHLDRQRPDGVWEDLANYRVSGNPRAPERANQAADWNREYSTLLDRSGTWTIRLTAFDFPDGQKRAGNAETFTIQVQAAESSIGTLAWIVALLLFLHLLLLETSRLWLRKFEPIAAAFYGLASFGLTSFCAFWIYYFNRNAGIFFAFSIEAIIVLSFGKNFFFNNGRADYRRLNALLLPATSLALVILIAGLYPFDKEWANLIAPAKRWLDLPGDNIIPKMFADQLWDGAIRKPMFGDWLSSDRPPLQTGAYLLFKALAPTVSGIYQVTSTWLQCTVLIPMISILASIGLRRGALASALLAMSICGSVMVNALFVWPKLWAATFTFIYYIALFPPSGLDLSRRARGVLAGTALALAMLSHGGAIFALLGISAWFVLSYRGEAVRMLATFSVPLAFVFYLPWMIYQRFLDPPGDRLLKWHFAGVIQPDDRTFAEALRSAYANLTPNQWLGQRWEQLNTIAFGFSDFPRELLVYVGGLLQGSAHPASIVAQSFYFLNYSLWIFWAPTILLCLAYLAYARRGIPTSLRAFAGCLVSGLLIWVALQFMPTRTVLHVGGYFFSLAAMAISMALVSRCNETIFKIAAWTNIALSICVYMLDRQLTLATHKIAASDISYLFALTAAMVLHYLSCRMAVQVSTPNEQEVSAVSSERLTPISS